jgi:phosphatidylserine/phosphatidylglycerophosphate/cardiolipin synthase-like enzyme
MSKVIAKSYVSPTLVFLAFDWPDGPKFSDFLGFAIERSPGHKRGVKSDFLLNKLGFGDPDKDPGPHPTDQAPIQKFHWWDSGINTSDRGMTFRYAIYPVRGTGPHDLQLIRRDAAGITVRIPHEEEAGIGTYFNRAVVSSQSFAHLKAKTKNDLDKEMDWLANGLQTAIPRLLERAQRVDGAIYHMTDNRWVVPTFQKLRGTSSIVYHLKEPSAKAKADAKAKGKKPRGDTANRAAVQRLASKSRTFEKRTKTNIMHHKFIVRFENDAPSVVLMGSTNFTPEAFTVQANLLHTFRSKQLARYYAAQQEMLRKDPTKAQTAKRAAWQAANDLPGTQMRVFFSPEPKGHRVSINTVVEAVRKAKRSVLFCMFSPTDRDLLTAIMRTGDRKKMMFGLLNSIVDPTKPKHKQVAQDPDKAMAEPTPSQRIVTEIFHRSQENSDIVSFAFFGDAKARAPAGFLPELSSIDTRKYSLSPPGRGVPTVHVHHKFIVIDGETATPTIYTGSANMSRNSVENNDENLLEIKGNTKLAQIYVAEFFRLYEHYRARALWNRYHPSGKSAREARVDDGLRLKTKRDGWVRGAYQRGSLEYISRTNLTSGARRA